MYAVVGYIRLALASVEELKRSNGNFRFERRPRPEEETYVLIGVNDEDPEKSLDSTAWLYIYRQERRSTAVVEAESVPDDKAGLLRISAPLVEDTVFDQTFLPTTLLRLENYYDLSSALEQGRSYFRTARADVWSESKESDEDRITIDAELLNEITGSILFANKHYFAREIRRGEARTPPWNLLNQIPEKVYARDIEELQYLIRDEGYALETGVGSAAAYYYSETVSAQTDDSVLMSNQGKNCLSGGNRETNAEAQSASSMPGRSQN